MKRVARLGLLLSIVSLLGATAPSNAAVNTIVAVANAGSNSFLPAVGVAAAPANFVQADALGAHSIVADQTAPGKPWCGAGKPFSNARCPVFYSDVMPAGGVTAINGFADLAPGTYTYHCIPHATMTGSIQVVA